MTRPLRPLAAAALAAALFAAVPTGAFGLSQNEEEPGASERATDLALESIEKLMRAMQLLLDSIPQYEAPEVLDNGDIIIRRKHDEEPAPEGEDGQVPEQKET